MCPSVSTLASKPDSMDKTLGEMMLHKLPQELYDQIGHCFVDMLFTPGDPGYIYPLGRPEGAPESEVKTYGERPKPIPSLLYLSKGVDAEYRERVYAKNVFVYGSGQSPKGIMGPPLNFGNLRANAEVAFGLADYECLTPPGHPLFDDIPSRLRELLIGRQMLLLNWTRKLSNIMLQWTRMDELTLDFRQCYDFKWRVVGL
ncbi:MAG: hypothetical protein Q9226_005559 [Calogaya cf. arnoldii]